jgi:hypothetical protein
VLFDLIGIQADEYRHRPDLTPGEIDNLITEQYGTYIFNDDGFEDAYSETLADLLEPLSYFCILPDGTLVRTR